MWEQRPNMIHSEQIENQIFQSEQIQKQVNDLNPSKDDAQIIFWGPDDDIATALDTIRERCQLAFEGVV